MENGSLVAWGTAEDQGNNANLVIWDKLGTVNASKHVLETYFEELGNTHISPNGRKIVCFSKNAICVWDRKGNDVGFDLQKTIPFDKEEEIIGDAVFLANGGILVASFSSKGNDFFVYDDFGTDHVQRRSFEDVGEDYFSDYEGKRQCSMRIAADGKRLVIWGKKDIYATTKLALTR